MGYHENAIRCVHFSTETNMTITGSWDSTIKFWDSRVPNCLGTCSLPDKVSIRKFHVQIYFSFRLLGLYIG